MTRIRSLARHGRAQSGAVMVTVAMLMPVAIGFAGFVADIGNWFAHKRHLQTQADAGALAGASQFRFPCTDAPILEEVSKYSSVDGDDAGWNPQIGGTPAEQLHQEINSPTWFDQDTPVDDTVRTGGPCAAKMIDVKLTETNLPWYMKIASFVPFINTQARVEIRQQTISTGALPVGVPEPGPKKARALFVNESTGTVIASTDLTPTGVSGGLSTWSNALPVDVDVNTAHIGVRIVLSGTTTTTACGDPLVNCYGAGTNAAITAGAPGLTHIFGYDDTSVASATTPRVRDVQMFSGSCADAYFVTNTAACSANIGAVVDFGGAPIDTVRVLAKKSSAGLNTTVDLQPPAASGGRWMSPPGFSVGAASGATSIDLLYQAGCPTNRASNCNTTKNPILPAGSAAPSQRIFSGSEDLAVSGPIKLLRLSEEGVPGANSFARGTTHSLTVTLGLQPTLQNATDINDPIVSLKVAGGGSQNQGLDCDPAQANIRDELANGCGPAYGVNTGQSCPGGAAALWGTAQPWRCVAINTGATVGQITQGMNLRVLGDTNPAGCTSPNNWADFPDFDRGDPRIVQVFLTPFGAFGGAGGTTVPVTGFATFYVTGWHNGACQGAGDDPAGQGSIVGHFIKYIDTLNNGDGGEEFCDFDALGSCVAVFTR